MSKKCFFCENELSKFEKIPDKVIYEIECRKCGKYKLSDPFLEFRTIEHLSMDDKKVCSWYIKNHQDEQELIIDQDVINFAVQEYKTKQQMNNN